MGGREQVGVLQTGTRRSQASDIVRSSLKAAQRLHGPEPLRLDPCAPSKEDGMTRMKVGWLAKKYQASVLYGAMTGRSQAETWCFHCRLSAIPAAAKSVCVGG